MRTLLIVLTLLVAAAAPAAATPEEIGAALPTPLEAGTSLYPSSGGRCANGFNARGHLIVPTSCGALGTVVRGPGLVDVGPIVAVRQTYAIVRITNTTAWVQRPTIAGSGGTITGSTETPVGGTVCAAGRTTGLRCGTVQAKNVTVNYPTGVVYGLTRTNLCSEPGDQWAPVFTGSQAQGHVLGGSGNCTVGGTSYFEPLNRVLTAEGLTLVTG
ncbi:S1 family peptidase [Saccharothrix sp. S26]|uniref:S1 family peptidase n=1 Tax=Saccharothrix sp. S26 TaxID=2907215 RepID=UPI001F4394CD|nr:S1 family peptidase [Saccharothrix sp. S26]MCE6999670.1 S1 family peptidase [Saccharothrix sp. S26]